jgi:hypothetical protein
MMPLALGAVKRNRASRISPLVMELVEGEECGTGLMVVAF